MSAPAKAVDDTVVGKENASTNLNHRCAHAFRDTEATRREFLASVAQSARRLMTGAFAGTVSPRQAIKAKCLDCCGYDRAEVAGCAVVLCPLHPYRPLFRETRRKTQKTASGSEIPDGTTSARVTVATATRGRRTCLSGQVSSATRLRESGRAR